MDVTPDQDDARWLVIGAPMEGSGAGRGEVDAPKVLREYGLVTHLGAVDFGDLPVRLTDSERDPETGVIAYQQLIAGTEVIADAVAAALHANWRPLVLGGCCSVLPGALSGLRRFAGPPRLVFVDGHLDLFSPQTTSTGELAGMALSAVTGYAPELHAVATRQPLVEAGDVLAIGDADLVRRRELGGVEAATALPDARVVDAAAVRSAGAVTITRRIEALLAADEMPTWLHLDVDVLDGSVMPAVSFPVSGGLTWDELGAVLAAVAGAGELLGVSLAGLNVHRDPGYQASQRLVGLLADVLT
ncbi:arginase family protein [Kribbella sp. NPDC048915]|uniref:arginase family protein n=1 Tax=Kribbella sp. NPDC048915 TaxID=3155148 RepID=UPI0033FAA994